LLLKKYFFCVVTFLLTTLSFAQKDTVSVDSKKFSKLQKKEFKYDALSPSKAAFYSAIFPGGGQIYNGKYWKAPIVWGAIGTSLYFYLDNNKEYDRYRKAYKLRKSGIQDEFTLDDGSVLISTTGLERAQKTLRNNRDVSLLVTAGLYVLQIVEASVNAHLLTFDDGDQISVSPSISPNLYRIESTAWGLKFKYSF